MLAPGAFRNALRAREAFGAGEGGKQGVCQTWRFQAFGVGGNSRRCWGAGKVRSRELARTKKEGGADLGGASRLKQTLSGWMAFWLNIKGMFLTLNWRRASGLSLRVASLLESLPC